MARIETQTKIVVHYVAVDGFASSRTFKTLRAAQKFAHKMVGEHPEIGTRYAVSADGVGKVTVNGSATLSELFPDDQSRPAYRLGRPMSEAEHEMYCDNWAEEHETRTRLDTCGVFVTTPQLAAVGRDSQEDWMPW